ncbi:putative quinol monooxygenase [Vibrio gazogenes]|uniref:Quinol monooxygenase YgiN n=1 Tax=Vibrio gazogenes DSM 21264 = NBRC 103151 TaxID=1123492 RepID=A0A1M5EVP4_VIBGA|nr:antibiotic biosynthesis monooxygenase [Vibrio gazogenes]USP14808.1 antibiotic biosynthesis monooxygenase [Vibrio gazogenes]SHF83112.1 Quinol monooxygenase YgiN [Vibrio gazogenes DSM 21264] [Vibrio gazogenes DSM 21264 = NBRC 103151]SJN55196.1 Antibiotic biosynthesis monooxygenase [Vibrio gazogenes]
MSKIILKGFILVPESALEMVKNELGNHQRLTLEEPGCMTFSVTENLENPLRFDVYEEFTDKAAFEHHQKRVKASHWGQVTVNVERHYEIFD